MAAKRLTVDEVLQIIGLRAQDTTNIFWTQHALERMTERGASPTSALRVIQEGQIVGGPDTNAVGGWQCTLRRRVAGLPISVV